MIVKREVSRRFRKQSANQKKNIGKIKNVKKAKNVIKVFIKSKSVFTYEILFSLPFVCVICYGSVQPLTLKLMFAL